jgi:hypothetical protein
MLENTHGCGEGCLYLGKLQSFAPWSTDWCTRAAHEVVCGPTEGVWVCAGGNGTPKDSHITLHDFLWISVEIAISPKWTEITQHRPGTKNTHKNPNLAREHPTSPRVPIFGCQKRFLFRPAGHARPRFRGQQPTGEPRTSFPNDPRKVRFFVWGGVLCVEGRGGRGRVWPSEGALVRARGRGA